MKLSSAFKVGLLTIVALALFLFTVLWVKGRSFSSAERIEVQFKDVNGMRPGSGVQMMGLRVGQVEEIIPVVEGESSYVKLKFVVTEPGISIPKASMLSIQQSGLIGEQFLEITPPKIRSVYIPVHNQQILSADADVEIKLDEKYYNVGKVKKSQIMTSKMVPESVREHVKTSYAYKIDYFINLPGLIIPEFMKGQIITTNGVKKLRIEPLDNTPLPYPQQTSPYTVVEPMRIADFLDLQYKAAESLTETNRVVNELLNDKMITDLTQSVENFKDLTAQATTTLEKAEKLIETSRNDIDAMVWMMTDATNNFNKLATNLNGIVADEKFKPALYETADAISNMSKQLAPIIGAVNSKEFAEDLNSVMSNLNDISSAVNTMTHDENLKKKFVDSVDNLNITMCEVSKALSTVNGKGDKQNLKQIVSDTTETIANLKKFSEKLNKRFLLFRLMF
ncbi:MAG: MCE family protein [Cyanobacteria bacterium SIG31]|nr:MCE family protein [Cyanobacteria bacterium SIG31]